MNTLLTVLLGTAMACAQSTNSYLTPYGMSAGMSV
jgi:hypothetical protein